MKKLENPIDKSDYVGFDSIRFADGGLETDRVLYLIRLTYWRGRKELLNTVEVSWHVSDIFM
jgi:hypothetical protein